MEGQPSGKGQMKDTESPLLKHSDIERIKSYWLILCHRVEAMKTRWKKVFQFPHFTVVILLEIFHWNLHIGIHICVCVCVIHIGIHM